MDLKVAFVIVCLCALAITSTEAGIPKCCIATRSKIPIGMIIKAHKVVEQKSSGACDIEAVVLYFQNGRKPTCAHPKYKELAKLYRGLNLTV